MKRRFSNIFLIISIITYLLSTTGIAIHSCSCSGEVDMAVMIGDISCESFHVGHNHKCEYQTEHHQSSNGHVCDGECSNTYHKHVLNSENSNCCETELVVLNITTDTVKLSSFDDLLHNSFVNIDIPYINSEYLISRVNPDTFGRKICKQTSSKLLELCPILALNSQWRV